MYPTAKLYTPEFLDMNWFSSYQERGAILKNKCIKVVINIRWANPPYDWPSTGEFVRSCTTHSILNIFVSWSSLICNGPWWLGQTIVFAPTWTILTGEISSWLFFHKEIKKSGGGGSDHILLCALQFQESRKYYSEYKNNIYFMYLIYYGA